MIQAAGQTSKKVQKLFCGKMLCNDCDVFYPATDRISCEVCGMQLIRKVVTTSPALAQHGPHQDDILDSLFSSFTGIMNERATKPLSVTYLQTLGKIVLDERKTLLFNASLHIGPLRLICIPAIFSQVPTNETITADIRWADPIHGSSLTCDDSRWIGNIVLMQRGVVSFARKYAAALRAGAAAVIVCQTFDIWPFVMSDNSNELPLLLESLHRSVSADASGDSSAASESDLMPHIPILMISKADGDILMGVLNHPVSTDSSNRGLPEHLPASLRFDPPSVDCAICTEDLQMGEEVVKLVCGHVFHCACIFRWLDKHSTCPICRKKMPSATPSEAAATARTTGPAPNYFV